MNHDRALKFFAGIVPEDKIINPKPVAPTTDPVLEEILWDAFNGRGKRAARKRERSKLADEYIIKPEDDYLDIDTAIDEVLNEINQN